MSDLINHRIRCSWTEQGGASAGLPDRAVRWLGQRIGQVGPDRGGKTGAPAPVAESALTVPVRTEFEDLLGADHVLVDPRERLGRTGGLSYLDLLHTRAGDEVPVPDAVLLPADPDQVQAVLDLCVKHDIGVVPFGGGTSVVGGVAALRGDKTAVVVLDLMRLDELVSVDPVSRIAVLQAGVRGPEAERLLAAHGYTLGHVPQSFERATIGGFAATRSAGQASSGYGRFEDMVAGVRLATPKGEWRLGVAPAVRGRTGPAAARGRQRGHARRDHRGRAAGPPVAGAAALRGLDRRRLGGRGGGGAQARSGPRAGGRHPAVRCGRNERVVLAQRRAEDCRVEDLSQGARNQESVPADRRLGRRRRPAAGGGRRRC